MLARAAVALWTVLEPRLLADLRRLRDRMVEVRAAGLDIEPAVRELRSISNELRQRNFVGTIVAYRRLKSEIDGASPASLDPVPTPGLSAEIRHSPSA